MQFNCFTFGDTYEEFAAGWQKWRQNADVYWDPKDKRWETYSAWIAAKTGLPSVGLWDLFGPTGAYDDVCGTSPAALELGGTVCWNPRDGNWYRLTRKEKPKPPEPEWVKRLRDGITAIDEAGFDPADRKVAVQTLINTVLSD